jgi:hypothetical protein
VSLIAAIHTIATLVFIAGSGVVAIRLLWLAHRTRQLPELLLGSAILCSALLGYGVMIASLVIRGGVTEADAVPALAVWLMGIGRCVHDLGVTLFLAFVVYVFRRRAPWAWALAGTMAFVMWSGVIVAASRGSFRAEQVGSLPWWCEYVVIWTYPLWALVESYRYGVLVRRRVLLGLASPLVANRFFLWATGALFTFLATATASIPYLMLGDLDLMLRWTPAIRVATALLGLLSIGCSLFAFLPPAWYRRWFDEPRPQHVEPSAT